MAQATPFVFVCCHHGAEAPLKDEFTTQGWRLAFSRPGFVSFKSNEAGSLKRELPHGVFARSTSWSIGRVQATETAELTKQITWLLSDVAQAAEPAQLQPAATELDDRPSPPFPPAQFEALHLWARDRLPVGEHNYETGPEALTQAAAEDVAHRLHASGIIVSGLPNQPVDSGRAVLDVVMIDPGQWMIGWHQAANSPPTRWAGGFPPLDMSHDVVSRAYFKAAEALLWSRMPLRPGETVVEIGSAPGGAAQRLLELGMQVIGVDPAEMDPDVAEHPNFEHIRARGGDVKRSCYRDAKWLLVDSTVRPDKTLVTVENIVGNRQVKINGMLLTMKIGRYDQADRIPGWCRTIRQWGFTQIEVRQLATGKCEVCIAAKRPINEFL
ncbi:SAM-dependent methyltransferase [Planctomycetaceae bacterium SH139]